MISVLLTDTSIIRSLLNGSEGRESQKVSPTLEYLCTRHFDLQNTLIFSVQSHKDKNKDLGGLGWKLAN